MELLVHVSTSGHLLVATSLEVAAVATQFINVHVIIVTPHPHLLLFAVTIFVRVRVQRVLIKGMLVSIHMLYSGMARFVRAVVHAASSTIHHGSPRT